MLVIVLLALSLLIIGYGYLVYTFNYWKRKGVASPPVSYIFGNLTKTFTMEKSLAQIAYDIYNEYPNDLYVGYYKIRTPGIVLRDLDVIKTVMVKNYQSFYDNESDIDMESDPIGARNLFVLKGETWRTIKNLISPCFTPKKLRELYPLLQNSTDKLIRYLENEPDTTGPNGIEATELMAKFTTENVACCVFGLEGNCFEKTKSKFREMGDKIFAPSTSVIIKNVLLTLLPSLSRYLKIRFFPEDVEEYFKNIIMDTIKYREKNNIVRNDFLDIINELKTKSKDYKFTDADVVAQLMGFFSDGYITSTSAMGHILYELGANCDVQETLLQEINETLEKNHGKIDYDVLSEMPYLENVFNETIRMHSPVITLFRIVTQPTTLPNPKGTGPDVHLDVGSPILIPALGIHNNPQYFPDPERFNPERFNDNCKELRSKFMFLPFGDGHRICHGRRFAIMQVKFGIVQIVRNFEIRVNKKTKVPLEIDPMQLVNYPKGGIWLNFIRRNK